MTIRVQCSSPITPDQAVAEKIHIFPDEVINAFNVCIVRAFDGSTAIIYKDEVVREIESRGILNSDIYEKRYLDVESIYHKAGWKVQYEKPDPGCTGRAFFQFSRRRQGQDD